MVKPGDVVHCPAGWAIVDEVHWRKVGPWQCIGEAVWLVVTVERPDGTDDPHKRTYRLDEVEPAVLGGGHV